MSDLCIFLNTRVEGSGILASTGDEFLAPFRYLFNGKTIRIQPTVSGKAIEIHHVASFHKKGGWNQSKTDFLSSSPTGMFKTIFSILGLIPGTVLGAIFKGLAYLSSSTIESHRFTKEHLTPIKREIGSVEHPITDQKQLERALRVIRNTDRRYCPTNALIIHGDGALTIQEDPGILWFNPMKLVLEGARIVHGPSHVGCLDEAMYATGKWQTSVARTVTGSNQDSSFANANKVNTVEEALQASAPRRSWTSCKRYHMIFELARPKAV